MGEHCPLLVTSRYCNGVLVFTVLHVNGQLLNHYLVSLEKINQPLTQQFDRTSSPLPESLGGRSKHFVDNVKSPFKTLTFHMTLIRLHCDFVENRCITSIPQFILPLVLYAPSLQVR